MGRELFLDFFTEHEVPVIRKRRHTFLKMDDENVYILKEGVVKVSVLMRDGILIDLKITNDDIAGFCGISTRHSVNRILRGLREENVIRTLYNKIMVLDVEYLKQFVDVKVDA